MPRSGRGRYSLEDCARWYIGYLSERLASKEAAAPQSTGSGLLGEQERLTKVKADREELELAKARGEVIPIEVYHERMASRIMSARVRFLALAARIAPTLESEDRSAIKSRLRTEIYDVLTALSAEAPENESDRAGSFAPAGDDGRGRPVSGGRRPASKSDVGTAARRQRERMGKKKSRPSKGNKRASGSVSP